MSSSYLTVQEASNRIRAEHRTVRRAIHRGELEAAMIGGKWLITEEALDAWVRSRLASPRAAASRRSSPRVKATAGAASVARIRASSGR